MTSLTIHKVKSLIVTTKEYEKTPRHCKFVAKELQIETEDGTRMQINLFSTNVVHITGE